jgi:hypothetical protein
MHKLIVFLIAMLFISTIAPSAYTLSVTNPENPEKPTITGPTNGKLYEEYEYTITSEDPQNDDICYIVRCSDCPSIFQSEWFESGETMMFHHCWYDFYQKSGPFKILAKAVDSHGFESEWGTFEISIENIHLKNRYTNRIHHIINNILLQLSTFGIAYK